MDGELRTSLQEQHPEFSSDEIELLLCCHFSSEICAKLASSSDWIQDPSKLLSDLRYLEQWRSEIISGDPRKFEQFTIHREKFSLFTELRGEVQRIVRELREVQPATRIPVSADRLETLWHNLETVEFGSDDHSDAIQTSAYNVWRILKDEIETMKVFCQLVPKSYASGTQKQNSKKNNHAWDANAKRMATRYIAACKKAGKKLNRLDFIAEELASNADDFPDAREASTINQSLKINAADWKPRLDKALGKMTDIE